MTSCETAVETELMKLIINYFNFMLLKKTHEFSSIILSLECTVTMDATHFLIVSAFCLMIICDNILD